MAQAKRMSNLVQRDAVQVDGRANSPDLIGFQMHVAGDRLGIPWGRIERVAQDSSRTVEGIRVAMGTAAEEPVDRFRGRWHLAWRDLDLGRPGHLLLCWHALGFTPAGL